MKYLSKEELEDITKELLENPTRETLKVLNNKYNKEEEIAVVEPKEEPKIEETNFNIPTFDIPEPVSIKEPSGSTPLSVPEDIVPITNEPKIPVNNNINTAIPSLEVPQTVPVQNNSNKEVNFSGNLWEPQMPTIGNMMETTDNFNTVQNTMPNINTNNQNMPFFGPASEPVNNPIPVNNGPSMFGQIQQNYNQ